MNTPLQQAAHAVIDRWDSPLWKDQPHTSVYIAELRKALEAEQAQAVGPVALHGFKASHAESGSVFLEPTSIQIGRAQQAQAVEPVAWMHPSRDPHLVSHSAYTYGSASVPLYTHPAPPPAQQGLSLDLLERLSKTLINLGYSTPEGGTEHFGAQIESQLYNLCRGVDSILAQQVAVPATDAEKMDLVTNWFSEEWAVKSALGLLDDYEHYHGITHSDYLDVQEALRYLEQVFLAATPSTPPAGERAELISRLRVLGKSATIPVLGRAANMLEADVLEIAATVRQVEILSDELSKCSKAQQVAVPVPLTDDEIMQLGRLAADQEIDISKPTWEQFSLHLTRAIEAHHGITAKPPHTDWSAA